MTAVAVEHDDQTKAMRWPVRDQATLALLAGCGLRVSELCALTWNQIAELDTDHPVLRVRGKGGRDRVVPLPPRWLRHAGVARRPGALAHSFRHTAADGWLDSGATLAEVQALLGHASIATTGIYTKARPDTLAQVTRAGRYATTVHTGR